MFKINVNNTLAKGLIQIYITALAELFLSKAQEASALSTLSHRVDHREKPVAAGLFWFIDCVDFCGYFCWQKSLTDAITMVEII